jgi:hypothetical protein
MHVAALPQGECADAQSPVHACQKNAASARTSTMMAPMAGLEMVPQNRPTATPQPASKLGNSGCPA